MLKDILSGLTVKAVAITAGALVLVMAVLLGIAQMGKVAAQHENKGLKADLVTTNAAWNACKSDLDTAHGKITEQNAQIGEWRDKAAAIQKTADAKLAVARKEAAQYRDRAARIAREVPKGDHCKAASDLYQRLIEGDAK